MSIDAGVARVANAIGARVDARPLAIMLDVDGTLAPIAPRPEDARVPDDTRRLVERLVDTSGVHVALVSGRSADDAVRLVGVPGVWALGNHGMETRAPDGALHADPSVAPYESAIAAAARELERLAAETSGAILENKRLTLSLHYRLVDERIAPTLIAAAKKVAADARLRATDGKKVVEVRPPVRVDKGTATVALAERIGALGHGGAVLFAGDDRTDEDAFRALRQRSELAITIRVGGEGETTDAEFRVAGPEEFRDLLATIVGRVSADA